MQEKDSNFPAKFPIFLQKKTAHRGAAEKQMNLERKIIYHIETIYDNIVE